jgi:hypothetical protein
VHEGLCTNLETALDELFATYVMPAYVMPAYVGSVGP